MADKQADGSQLLAYLDALVEKLREQMPLAIKGQDEDAIHQSRVTTRRLAAMLGVLKPILSKSQRHEFDRTLQKLRKKLGPLRDLDVMIGHLDELKSARHRPATQWVLDQLGNQRDGLRQSASDKIDPPKVLAKLGAWWGIREEIVVAQQAIDSLLGESLHLQLDTFIDHADGVTGGQTGESAMSDPHELRIAGKALRYTLEMAVENGHKLPTSVTRSFKKMQDALGLWHDYVVLAQCVMSLSIDGQLAHHDVPLQIKLLDVTKVFLTRAAQALARFGEIWKQAGQQVSQTIRETFPLTMAVVNESQTDPDQIGSEQSADDSATLLDEASAS